MHIARGGIGGVDQYLWMLLKKMDLSKFENILVCSEDFKQEKYEGIVSKFMQISICREIKLSADIVAITAIRRLIKKYRPDIIYAHSSKAGAVARVANIGLNSRCIYNPHGWSFDMKGCSKSKIKAYILLERILAKFCSKIIAISDYEKESAIKNKICENEKIQVIYNGIDLKEHNEAKILNGDVSSICKIPEDCFVIGCAGRLSEQKAPDAFIQAAQVIKKKISNAHFLMVGDGEKRKEVEQLIKELRLEDCVHITGWVGNPLDYIRKFDIAMLLSRWEGFGLVLAEYMLEGKPIIATDVGAIPDIIINEHNGLIVEMDDYNAITNAVVRIYEDMGLRERLIRNGQNIVHKKFNIERVVQEHEAMFHAVLIA